MDDRVDVAGVVGSGHAVCGTASTINTREAEIELEGLAVGLDLYDRIMPAGNKIP